MKQASCGLAPCKDGLHVDHARCCVPTSGCVASVKRVHATLWEEVSKPAWGHVGAARGAYQVSGACV